MTEAIADRDGHFDGARRPNALLIMSRKDVLISAPESA